jgi:hypothetical protein
MKPYFLISVLLLIVTTSFTQARKKPATNDKPPTQKEMADMMKEVQQAMDEISPEDKKMMDSMGFKMPDTKAMQKNVSGISDAQLKKAYEDENRIVPQKDPTRITTALTTTLTSATMSVFIDKTHQEVLSRLSAKTKSKGVEILLQLSKRNTWIANTAVGLWIDGKPTLALYLMGEACKSDPSNANNLNNYASFLTMCGAEQLALPILNHLNKRYPKNSTVLNNITQAWLGLGDIVRADKYADSTIRIHATHPQANMAKCLIEESKGNIPAAIAAAKRSISKAYSNEKENKLKKLGYDLQSEDLNWNGPMEKDQLGLAKFNWPAYPLAVEENKLAVLEWNDFKTSCQQKIDELKLRQPKLEEDYSKISQLRVRNLLEAGQKGQVVQAMPTYAAKAIKKLGPAVNDVNGNMSFVFAQELEPVFRAKMKMQEYHELLAEKQALLDKKYEDKVGEGRENPLEQICKDENAIRTEFLKNVNGLMQSTYRQYLNYVSRRTSDLLNYYQYTLWPEQFELVKVNAQLAWLTQIKDQTPAFKSKSSWCIIVPVKKGRTDSLQNFDDVACKYVSTMDLGVYKIVSSCSNLTGEFDFGGVKIDLSDNVETGRYSGSAMVGVSKSIDGPMGTELEASVAALVEWDNTGFTDGGGIAGISANAGGTTIVGAEIKATVNTGVSTTGKGILQGNK